MIKFFLVVNRFGQLRLNRYYEKIDAGKRRTLESFIIHSCLHRRDKQCTIFQHEGTVIIYRKFVTLYFIAGVTPEENELSVLEFMNNFLETLNCYFEKVTELDMIFNLDRTYMILDEMIINGTIAQTAKQRILAPIQLMDAAEK